MGIGKLGILLCHIISHFEIGQQHRDPCTMPRGSGTGRVSLLGSAGGTHVSHRPIGGGAFDGGSEGSTTTTDANSVSENGDGSRYNVKKAKKKQSKKRKRLLSDVMYCFDGKTEI